MESREDLKTQADEKYKHFEPLPFISDEEHRIKEKKKNLLKNPNDSFFVPNEPTLILEVTAERQSIQHLIHPYIYTFFIKHNNVRWEIRRTYKELKELHKVLTKLVKSEFGIRCSEITSLDIKADWPLFPTKHDGLITEDEIQTRCHNLSSYLSRVIQCLPFRDHPAVLNFLSVSFLSFNEHYSQSFIEEFHYKRETKLSNISCRPSRLCCDLFNLCYGKRWICLKDTYIVYLNPKYNNAVGFVILVDSDFQCKIKTKWNAYFGLEIKNLQRKLFIRLNHFYKQQEWYQKINLMLESEPGRFFYDHRFLKYDSYAPARPKQLCRWLMNGCDYMRNVMNGLKNAKHEIFITDWWLTPELYLIRPTDDLKYRLDKILFEKASQGVKIYVLLYKEIKFAVTSLMSLRARDILTGNGKNPNIMVLRHPGQFLLMDNVFLWSHHEKCVIIDQSVAFMGGIDLCLGRYDDDYHRLIDLGPRVNNTELILPKKFKNSKSESNIFKSMKTAIEKNSEQTAKEKNNLSMSTHSIDTESPIFFEKTELGNRLNKSPNKKQPIAFERSGTKLEMAFQNSKPIKEAKMQEQEPYDRPESKIARAFQKTPTLQKFRKPRKSTVGDQSSFDKIENDALTLDKRPPIQNNNTKYSKGPETPRYKSVKDEVKNNLKSHITRNKEPTQPNIKWATSKKEMIERNKKSNLLAQLTTGRRQRTMLDDDLLPSRFNTENLAFEDLELPKNRQSGYYYWIGKDYANAYHEDFKEIEVYNKDQFSREEIPRMPWRDQALVVFNEAARDLARHFIQRWNQTKNEQCPELNTYPYLMPKSYSEPINYNYSEWFNDNLFKCNVQITRSADDWSAGIDKPEHSILNAYLDLINKAEHYIYIENQFFITTTNPAKDDVKNTIGLALVNKIIQVHKENRSFKIYVFLPLLPGFDRMNAIKAVQYYNLRSIKFGQYSIYKMLKDNGINDPTQYITFHGMRNWAVLMGKLVQEIIYVHSKLLIVDDKYVITGSANINDRSMLGKRDSEIAAVVKDEEFIDSVLNEECVKVGKYASSLRKKIFKLHLGILSNNPTRIDVTDCACDSFYQMFREISHQNTKTYDEVFKCIPSDNLTTFKSIQNNHKQISLNNTDPREVKA